MTKQKLNDGAYKTFTLGLGVTGIDKTKETKAATYVEADLAELAKMKVQDGVAARIVEGVPETAFKNDIAIIGDNDGIIFKELSAMGLFEALQLAGEYQRLTGGAVIVTEYDDANRVEDIKKPVSNGAKVLGYRVYSSGKVRLNTADFNGDFPKVYHIERRDGVTVDVDPSRVTVIYGKALPDVLAGVSTREAFFGSSALKPCETSLKNLATVIGAVVGMASETGAMLFNLDGFNELMSRPDTGIRDAKELIGLVKYAMGSMRAAFMGGNDKINILSHNFAGLPEILQKLMNQVCADSQHPASILFGQTVSGLSQTNEGDLKAYGELVEKWRSRYMYRPACRLISDYCARNIKRQNVQEFTWGPVSVMTENELIEARAKQADTLSKFYQIGAISADEIREAVFVNGHSFEISLK